jgi:TPP-dependent pyruvate/acetoin dehydrogenase alpha subunit
LTANTLCSTPFRFAPTSRPRPEQGARIQALGRSQGGVTSKIRFVADAPLGRPWRFILTSGDARDPTAPAELPYNLTVDAVNADKTYESNAARDVIAEAGAKVVIPSKSSRKFAIPHDAVPHKPRNRIERLFNKLKHFRVWERSVMNQSAIKAIPGAPLEQADIERIYRSLRLIRRAEEQIACIYPSDKIKSPVHLSIGQEAVSVGVCDVLRTDDVVSPTYRGHAAFLAKGAPVRGLMAELYGKATGVAGGKGGSMHLIAMSHNVLGASAVVGTTIPVAVGYAFALKRMGTDRVVVAFFGDGATEEGVFAESINFASLHKLPVLFVCENNYYAIHTPITKRWATQRLCERVETYGIAAHQVDDGDVLKLRELAAVAIARVRRGHGPEFIECRTYRWREHVGPNEDFDAGYRARSDLDPWLKDDQVERIGSLIAPERRAEIDADVTREISEAMTFAETSAFPETEALHANVFSTK